MVRRSSKTQKTPRRRPGRPRVHAESWTKATVVLFDRQIAFLDKLAAGIREKSGVPISRAQLIRALIDAVAESDIDLTLVGSGVLSLFTITGFFVPGVHSRPLSDDDPDIAPELLPLREKLMVLAGRPVNIQGTRELVKYLRGDLIGQPYLTLFEKPEEPS